MHSQLCLLRDDQTTFTTQPQYKNNNIFIQNFVHFFLQLAVCMLRKLTFAARSTMSTLLASTTSTTITTTTTTTHIRGRWKRSNVSSKSNGRYYSRCASSSSTKNLFVVFSNVRRHQQLSLIHISEPTRPY